MRRWTCLLLACLGCAPQAEIACEALCRVATPIQAACLERDGLDWSATSWESEAGYRASCATWIWTQRRLARHATPGRPGRAERAVVAHCADFEQRLRTDPTCETYRALDWDAPAEPDPERP